MFRCWTFTGAHPPDSVTHDTLDRRVGGVRQREVAMAEHGQELPHPRRLRPAIARSWHRSDLVGLDPGDVLARLRPSEVDVVTPLMAAAGPVLDQLDESLRETKYCTVLVDRDCHVVHRWSDDRRIDAGLDELNIRIGSRLREEDIGTNALGTVLETRESLVINGDEHFAEALRQFSCYGHPIRHPLTRRIEGVLDITTISTEANPLLPALIARAVSDIEQRLLDGSRVSEKRLLDAFQAASALRRRAVIAIGEDLVLTNRAAMDLLGPGDVATLRVLAADPARHVGTLSLALDSGLEVTVEVTPVAGAARSALLQMEHRGARAVGTRTTPSQRARFRPSAPLLVCGPPGSGRSTRARELASREPVTVLHASAAVLDVEGWAATFEAAMRTTGGTVVVDGTLRAAGTVVVDGIDLLPQSLLELVLEGSTAPERPQLVLTSDRVEELTGRCAALAATATRREETLPLAARRHDLPALAARMLADLEPDHHLRLMPTAVAALTAHSWPGNLHELRAVLAHAVQRRWGEAISVKDLPDGYRADVPDRPIPALDQAQRDVIVATLRQHDGNKVRTAEALGLSRTTLYARMKSLRITTY